MIDLLITALAVLLVMIPFVTYVRMLSKDFGLLKIPLHIINAMGVVLGLTFLTLTFLPANLPTLSTEDASLTNQLILKESMFEGVNFIFRSNNILPSKLTNPKSIGSYSPAIRVIVLKDSATQEVLAHELGHHIWFFHLGRVDRENYKTIYQSGNHPTEYASTSKEEDFAESFELYALGYEKYLSDNRLKFMEEVYEKFR